MIPSPVYCCRCGGFTGQHRPTKNGKPVSGKHEHLEDCVEKLYERIQELEARERAEYL